METLQILKYWADQKEVPNVYKSSQLNNPRLAQDTIEFLLECGLPNQAAPCLNFNSNYLSNIPTVNEWFEINFEGLNDYVVIGSNGSGDPVCIDLKKGNEIVFLNHDNDFERIFINSSIKKFANCLIVYAEFIITTNASVSSNYLNGNFNHEEFKKLKEDLYNIDSNCLDNNTMWYYELQQ